MFSGILKRKNSHMLYIAASLFFFANAVWIHIRYCRRRRPDVLYAATFCVLVVVNGLGLLAVCMGLRFLTGPADASVWLWPLPLTAVLLYALLAPVYLAIYVSTLLVSPSKRILKLVEESGGLTYEDLVAVFDDGAMVTGRLQDLLLTGCVVSHDRRYCLSGRGRRVARALDVYQILIGRKAGG